MHFSPARKLGWAGLGLSISLVLAACGGNDVGPVAPASDSASTPTLVTFQAAEVVIGQAGFTAYAQNQGQNNPGDNTLRIPAGLAVSPDGRLFVADSGNHRILFWNAWPSGSSSSANGVLGQPGFTAGAAPAVVSATTLHTPTNISFGATHTAVVDSGSNRVLIFEGVPSAGAEPVAIIGQLFPTTSAAACTEGGLFEPTSAIITPNGKLIVADKENSRVLIWNEVPTNINAAPADVVLGQPAKDVCVANNDGPSKHSLYRPTSLWSDGQRLAVAERNNRRILIWDQIPTTDFADANLVLGQGDFTHVAPNDDDQDGNPDTSPTARTFGSLAGYGAIAFDGVRFAVADTNNHRVLVWNGFPTSNFQPADVVLGQATMTIGAANDTDGDGIGNVQPSAQTLVGPTGLLFWNSKLLVSDTSNHRVLVFGFQSSP